MRTWAKIFGVAALVSGAVSFTDFGSEFAWGALKPLSATFLGAAGICWFLAAEYARYDEERKRSHDEARIPNEERKPNDEARNAAHSSFELRR